MSEEKTEKVTLAEHVAETRRQTPVVGNVVTGDIVTADEVRPPKAEETSDAGEEGEA